MSVIVALSGGKSSAWCADWALKTYPREEVVLYFNDTKWEHETLYNFLLDLQDHLDHPITVDSDGRNVEQLCYEHHALANDRMPFCSRVLKAERLQRFLKDQDTLIFGIGDHETHRAMRLVHMYNVILPPKLKKTPKLRFPLIENHITDEVIWEFLKEAKIEIPLLYRLGFNHNNCSGGCVRSGKKSWKLLLEKLPGVYAEREKFEEEFRSWSGKDVHFLKDETLKHLRERNPNLISLPSDSSFECVGVCQLMA